MQLVRIFYLIFSLGYLGILYVEFDSPIRHFFKIVPLLILAGYLIFGLGTRNYLIKMVIAGFIFSMCGDVLLQFKHLFVQGLGAFLIAHIFYIMGFTSGNPLSPMKSIPFYLYGGILFAIMLYYPYLQEKNMAIPVLFYMITITTMGWRAAARTGLNSYAYKTGLIGACIFIISDSLIGVYKFIHVYPMERFFVMSTYYTAQFLIFESTISSTKER